MMFKLYKRYKEAKQATPEENAAAIEAAKARILAAGEGESPEFEMIFRDALSAKDNRVMCWRLIRAVAFLSLRRCFTFWRIVFFGW